MRRAVCITIGSLALLAIAYGEPATDKRFCADSNGDGIVDLSDAVTVLNYLFMADSREPYCVQENQSIDALTTRIAELETALSISQTRPRFPDCVEQEGRFVDNGDGTVTDNCTGLQWQQEIADTNGDADLNGNDALTWDDGIAYCETLEFVGHDDWRLPTIWELQMLVDYNLGGYANDVVINPILGRGWTCWSSTASAAYEGQAWKLHFSGGYTLVNLKSEIFTIKPVRSVTP